MDPSTTDPRSRRPLRPGDFADWSTYYWTYQHELARAHLIPTLQRWGVWREGVRILDVGCGDAGATCALAEAGAAIQGFDIEERRVTAGAARARERGVALDVGVADVTDESTLGSYEGPYDLVLFRDVLEHIPDVDATFRHCRARLAESGALVVIYPPYWSPFGGHQQILHPPKRLGLRWAKLPFVHWLPIDSWRALARDAHGNDDAEWGEILTIRRASLTLAGLRARAARHDLAVERSERYLLRPTFELRYGTPVWKAGWVGRLPGLREVFVTGSWDLLRRVDHRDA